MQVMDALGLRRSTVNIIIDIRHAPLSVAAGSSIITITITTAGSLVVCCWCVECV